MAYGLSDSEMAEMARVFASNEKVKEVILYGSRAKGTHKAFSDVDVTLVGDGLCREDIYAIRGALEESSLPYEFDVSIYSELRNEELRKHIGRVGKVVWKRD